MLYENISNQSPLISSSPSSNLYAYHYLHDNFGIHFSLLKHWALSIYANYLLSVAYIAYYVHLTHE